MRRGVVAALLVLTATACAVAAHAGQVRIDVGPGTLFVPSTVSLNIGDHVVWVWKGVNSHTVASGDGSTGTKSGLFDSDPTDFGTNQFTRFSWKSTLSGSVPFFCAIHGALGMVGTLTITDGSPINKVAVADFRITEVQYNNASGHDLIEITNYGGASGNLGRYRIATSTASSAELVGPAATPSDLIVGSGGRVVVHLNTAGTNTNADVFITSFNPGTGLGDASGQLALYVPNTITPALTSTDMILDYIEWGAGSQTAEATAVGAGFWASSAFLPVMASGHSMEYCADAGLTHGATMWSEVSVPNFGANGSCATPTLNETWGRVKTIYRK